VAIVSVKAFANFDSKLQQSIAIMGDVSDVMRDDMASAAREVAKQTTFSADEAAEAYYFLASAGLDAASSIKAMPQVAKFAQAGMFDMALATDLLADAQSALGLTVRDDANANLANMIKLSDTLVKANALANASVQQFSEALTHKAAGAMRSLGIEMETGIAVLATFADQGIKGSQAGTTFNAMIRGLTNGVLRNTAEFEKYNIQVYDAQGNFNNLADIIAQMEAAFGGMSKEQTRAALTSLGFTEETLAGTIALLGNSEAIKTYETSLRSASGFTDQVAGKQLETMSAQFDLLKSRVADVGIEIGAGLAPSLLEIAEDLEPLVDDLGPKFVSFFEDLVPIIEDVANKLTEDFIPALEDGFDWIEENNDAIGFFAVTLGTLLISLNLVIGATKLYTAAQLALNFAMKMNPILLVLSAVVALAAGVIYLAKQTTFFQDSWQAMSEGASKAWNGFVQLFLSVGQSIGSFFVTLGTNIGSGWDNTVEGLTGAIEGFGEAFESAFEGIGNFFKGVVNGYIGIWEGFINAVIGGLNGIIRAANKIQLDIPETAFTPAYTFGLNLPTIPKLNIPRLADGGIVMPRPGGVLANIAEAGKPEAVIPLDRMNSMGKNSVINITVNAGVGADGNRIGEQIVNEILRFERSSGRVFARA
jgi:TP901 family phage tail tape measure protein